MSRIEDIMSLISEKIASIPTFYKIPIFWDEIELNPNTGSFPCVLLKLGAWKPTPDCMCERLLEVRIIVEEEDRRMAMLKLWNFEQDLREALDEFIETTAIDFDLHLLGGSELAIMTYTKKDKDSYKGTGTMNGSVVIDYYRLRY